MDTVNRIIYSPDDDGLVVINGKQLFLIPESKRTFGPNEIHELVEENGQYFPRRCTEDGNWVEGCDPLDIDFDQFPDFIVDSEQKIV